MPSKKTIKAWALVIKTKFGFEDTPFQLLDSPSQKINCKCHKNHWHYFTPIAVFEKRKEALAYRKETDQEDFVSAKRVTITIEE